MPALVGARRHFALAPSKGVGVFTLTLGGQPLTLGGQYLTLGAPQ